MAMLNSPDLQALLSMGVALTVAKLWFCMAAR